MINDEILELRLAIIETLCKYNFTASNNLIITELREKGLDAYPQKVNYHLSALTEKGLIQRKNKGLYQFVGPYTYCMPFLDQPRYSLIAGLGERQSRKITVVEVAIRELRSQNIIITRAYVLITNKSKRTWGQKLDELEQELKTKIDFIEITSEAISDLTLMSGTLEGIVARAIRDSIPIIDCTSLTKIYTISAYTIAIKHSLPLIYIYEKTQKLNWLQDLKTTRIKILNQLTNKITTKQKTALDTKSKEKFPHGTEFPKIKNSEGLF